MALASISLRGFRNIEPTTIEFDRGANYLFGPNGAGKTNLLEAIHYLAIGRSFRRCPDAELLGFGQDVFVVSGADESGERAEIRCDCREKRVLRNDIPVQRLSEYFGWLPVVILLLEDIELVRGAPGIRRSFLDLAIAKTEGGVAGRTRCPTGAAEAKSEVRSQSAEGRSAEAESYRKDTETPTDSRLNAEGRSCSSPPPSPLRGEGERSEGEEAVGGLRWADSGRRDEQNYITLTVEYRRAVSQYNRLLERGGERREQGGEELGAWEEEVVRRGVPVYEARLARTGELLENAARHYERLAGHEAVFSYRSSILPATVAGDPSQAKPGDSPWESQRALRRDSPRFCGAVPVFEMSRDLAEAFRQRLSQTRERARVFGHAVVGPHRDDIRIARGDRELRKFGSVGEQRLAGIALRLAEADMILSAGRQRPVFLLDEVASELDEQRSRLVLAMVAERGQMVYAAARRIAPPRKGSRDQGIEGSSGEPQSTVRDAATLEHLTTGPLDHFSGKEFHVEAGQVTQVS